MQLSKFLLLLLICVWPQVSQTAPAQRDWKSFIPKNYTITPLIVGDTNNLVVSVTLSIVAITTIMENNMEYYADLEIALKWFDYRLFAMPDVMPFGEADIADFAYDEYVSIPSDIYSKLWRPKVYIGSGHQGDRKNLYGKDGQDRKDEVVLSYFFIHNNVEMHTKPNIRLFCPFRFHNFPFDIQHCPIRLQFDVSTPKGVEAKFDDDMELEPVLHGESPSLQLDVKKVTRSYCVVNQSVGNFSCLELKIKFKRRLSTYISQIFIPSTMIVVLSWFSFWLDVEAAPARISLGVTALLTLSTSFSQNQRSLPAVAYMKAIDLWMFFCIFYVFMTLVEFTVAYTINRRSKKLKKSIVRKQIVNITGHKYVFTERGPTKRSKTNSNLTILIKKVRKINWNIDDVARVLFPTFFLLFIATFLLYYTHEMQKGIDE